MTPAAVVATLAVGLLADAPLRAASPDSAPPLPAPSGRIVRVSTEPQLRAAVAAIDSGTTILIAPGTYRLTASLVINKAVEDVAIRGASNDRDDVVLMGRGMAAATDAGVPYGIWTGGGVTRVTIANLTIADVFYHPIIFNAGTQQPRVYNVRLLDAGQQFLKANPDGHGGGVNGGVVEYCVFEYTTAAKSDYTNGVDVHTGNDWVIRHSVFRRIRARSGLAGPAILMWNHSQNTVVEANTFIDNHRDIHFGLVERTPDDHRGGIIRNNMIARTSGAGGDVAIGVFDSPGTLVIHNSVFMNDAYPNAVEYRFAGTTGGLIAATFTDARITGRNGGEATLLGNVLTARPSDFVSVASGDLHLTAAATAAIDRALPRFEAPTDWDGDRRPSGAAADVGADERPAASAPPLAAATTPARGIMSPDEHPRLPRRTVDRGLLPCLPRRSHPYDRRRRRWAATAARHLRLLRQ